MVGDHVSIYFFRWKYARAARAGAEGRAGNEALVAARAVASRATLFT